MVIYKRIRDLREDKDLTQKELANYLNVSQKSYSRYERGERTIAPEILDKIATFHETTVDYLLGRTPDVFVDEADKESLDISLIKKKYDFFKKKIKNLKKEYKNENAIIIAVNELCSGVGKTSYGESKSNAIISIEEIDNLFNDLENSKFPKPQIMMKVKDIEKGIIIVEIDSFDDEELPINATERIALYTAKLSKEYNVLGLAMTIDKDENCKIIDAVYQKNNDSYYTQLYLPKTVLTAGEYIDIMKRL